MGGISIWQLVIVALIILLLFGTKKLRSLGSDLGESVKGFKKAMSEDKPQDAQFNQVEQKAETQSVSSETQNAKEKSQG